MPPMVVTVYGYDLRLGMGTVNSVIAKDYYCSGQRGSLNKSGIIYLICDLLMISMKLNI